ncbi:MAG: DNA polymerase III subunit delta [Bacilli bacterium]|nr:DNA polymerase III subunit delta [Bacilli bacterium]
MQNNYLLEGQSFFEIENEINNIVKSLDFNDALRSNYDLSEVEFDNVLEDLDTYSFLSSKKIIILTGMENVNNESNKDDLEHLYKYLDNPNPDNLLFIWSLKFNNTLKVTKELKKRCKYISVSLDPIKFAKNELKGYKISNIDIEYLVNKCLNDLSKIENEINKLKNYKYEEKTISREDIDELVMEKLGDSTELTFAFSRSLAEKDKKRALEQYFKLLNYNIEPLSIIGLIASQIRIIYQVKVLEKQRLSNDEIASMLGEKNSYRIKKTKELTRYYSEDELLELMKTLADMDYKLKTTDSDPNNLIELFILNLK